MLGISLDEDGADAIKPFLVKNPINYHVGSCLGAHQDLLTSWINSRSPSSSTAKARS